MSDKELLVFDEPMDDLDPKARLLVKRLMGELRQRGSGVFFSTHVLGDVQGVCDQLAILHAGSMRFSGSPAQCMARFGGDDLEQAYLHCIEGSDTDCDSDRDGNSDRYSNDDSEGGAARS